MSMESKQGLWYVRQEGEIKGPFSATVITNHLIVGRMSANDEISTDKRHWTLVRHHPELQPQFDSDETERTRRLLDERTGLDRRRQQQPVSEAKPRTRERRAHEPEFEARRRELRRLLLQKYRQRKQRAFWPVMATSVILLLLLLLAVRYPTTLPVPLPNCSAPAKPEVNWNNCLKPELDLAGSDLSQARLRNSQLIGSSLMNSSLNGADLAYADLRFVNFSYSDMRGATLLGANLAQADLSYSDLSNADLSYADLSDANLGSAKLDNARFDNTIWLNGQLCAPGSVGGCIPLVR
jgi:hypothetical protein